LVVAGALVVVAAVVVAAGVVVAEPEQLTHAPSMAANSSVDSMITSDFFIKSIILQ
jgi:hypothetical protein